MMRNLRIVSVKIVNSDSISVKFTEPLTSNLVTYNVAIISDTLNVPDANVIELRVVENVLEISCLPLTSLASYYLLFKSTSSKPFVSLNGGAKILEDGVANKYHFVGPAEPNNPIKSYLLDYIKDNVYNVDDETTTVGSYIRSLSKNLAKALYDIRQVKNENYLSVDVVDELKIRGTGPSDRLSQEGAYEIVRVGRASSGANVASIISFATTPFYPVTLQRALATEYLIPDSINNIGKFNINDLILNLSQVPITRVNKIIFNFNSINPIYIYNIENLGYQIFDSKYDQSFGSTYPLLKENQIKISDNVLTDPLFDINNIINIEIQYEYKNLGLIVNHSTVSAYTEYTSIREVLPPIINVFNFKHAPIVDSNGKLSTLNGVAFIDSNKPPGSVHPAFKYEVPFRLEALPSLPGQYSIDYSTGTAYVYGEDFNNDGTGPFPPLATYNYQYIFKINQDYVYDATSYDFIALPLGNVLEQEAKIIFSYQQVLIPNVDYAAQVHKEALSERIDNRITSLNSVRVKNTPITNVFRVYNETSGEIYTIDRWNDDKIFIRYNDAPSIENKVAEKISLNTITNELLFVDSTISNSSLSRIFRIFLKNNSVSSLTEDSLGSFINSSLALSNTLIFIKEKWFNRNLSSGINLDKLSDIGEYCVDYKNGIIYCVVSSNQNNNIGTATYKSSQIALNNPHIISIDDIYYQIDPLGIKNKQVSYLSFKDGFVSPDNLEYSDEDSLNNIQQSPYQILSGSVGSFVDANFILGVTNQVQSVRGLFVFDDLTNSTNPINFSNYCAVDNFNITVSDYTKSIFQTVKFDGINFYILLDDDLPYLCPNITYNFSATRVSDSAELWDTSGIIVPGNPAKLVLSGINSPSVGDLVGVNYSFSIDDLSRIIVDYNKGNLCIDYSYLADEIIVSYEYGDNVIDFRASSTIPANTSYHVSYRVGALRDSLLKNFGNLINIPELTNFDLEFDRERYRDALTAAMSSFIQGPTLTAIKNIGKTISHVEPEVTESAFQGWSLGSSLLNPSGVNTTGHFELLPAKFGDGALIRYPNQTITLPASSNLRLEEGTFETWILPQWNGIDNDAQLTFNITRDGNQIDPIFIFVGASEYHPTLNHGKFVINKINTGTPNLNKDGIFIYYDKDLSGAFDRWYVKVIDGSSSTYKVTITSNGTFYDSKSISIPKPSNLNIFTGLNSINLTVNGSSTSEEGITFLSDIEHYILDFGQEKNISRLSFFKDISGYINFRVYDKNSDAYLLSADVSSWKPGDLHHLAISWKLDNEDGRDEMHLFVDGLEVPNIIKHGQRAQPYLHEKFRIITQEEIVGSSNKDIVSSTDLNIVNNNAVVSSSINFSAYNISIGDLIYIDEQEFDEAGYSIVAINGQTLTLNQVMPLSMSNGRFSVNRTSFPAGSDIDVAAKIAVSRIPALIVGNDLNGSMGSNIITSLSYNFYNLGVKPGNLIRIDNLSTTDTYTIVSVSGNTVTITDSLPIALSNNSFKVYSNSEIEIPGIKALSPAYSVSKDINYSNALTISNDIFANDLILIRTFGINHKTVKNKCYLWGDSVQNILMTHMPPPISLDEVNVTKVILPATAIDSSNSVLLGGIYYSNDLITAPPSNSPNGRMINVTISGNNVDFSVPVSVTVNGVVGVNTINETIILNDYGTLDFTNYYLSINYIKVDVKPINANKAALVIDSKEKYPVTYSEFSTIAPAIKYSYYINGGVNLYSTDGYTVTDDDKLFNGSEINNYLVINSPSSVSGFYLIKDVSFDRKSLTIEPVVPSASFPLSNFVNGIYQIFNINERRSGFQNGFFTFELGSLPSQPYLLSKGFYEIEYSTYTKIKMNPMNFTAFIGSNFNGNNQINAILDQVKSYSIMLADTRIGESLPSNQMSITKDYNSIKPLRSDSNTLMLLDFNSYPFINSADYYTNSNVSKNTKKYFQSSVVVSESFNNSLVLLNKPIIISNDGILNTKKQGTIEFWINPLFDTANDPHDRYYLDAFGAVVEEAVSANSVSVRLASPASKIISVTLENGDPAIDYFAGGSIDTDTQNAIQESVISTSSTTSVASKNILQVIKVEIVGDLSKKDYFAEGSIGTDRRTIYLGKELPGINLPLLVTYKSAENKNIILNTQIIRLNRKLPYQNSQVLIKYIPKGLQGDRLSIYKDKFGHMNFSINASGTNYLVKAPIVWGRNTWHRIKASYKINGGQGKDEMRLFLDGYQYSSIILVPSSEASTDYIINNYTDGNNNIISNIKFKDTVNNLFIGSQYDERSPIFSLIDNLRISDISRPIYAPYGYPIDINYTSNIDMAFPVTVDLHTTYLLDFDQIIGLNKDFATIKNRNTGSFDFSVNILDSFGIVNGSLQAQSVLEKLIKVLKPANSKVFITYTKSITHDFSRGLGVDMK